MKARTPLSTPPPYAYVGGCGQFTRFIHSSVFTTPTSLNRYLIMDITSTLVILSGLFTTVTVFILTETNLVIKY